MNKKNKPAGPKGNFLLGSTKEFAKDTIGFVSHCREEFKNIALAKIAFRDFYLLFQPEYIHYVLQDNYKNYYKSFAYKGFRKILGNGLLTSEGNFWLKQRRLSQPAFHKEKLTHLVRNMHTSVYQLMQEWKKSNSSVINFTSTMRLLSQEMVTASLFSTSVTVLPEKLDWILDKLRSYANNKMKNPFMAPLFIPTSSNRSFLKAMKELDEVIYDLIRSRKESRQPYQDLLSMLMEARDEESGEGMSLRQLRVKLLLFL
jgi:cytochrome P450